MLQAQHRVDRIVYTEVLVVLGHDLPDLTALFLEQREVLHQVQQPGLFAGAFQQRLQRHAARLGLAADLLPITIMFPRRRHAAQAAFDAVGDEDQAVVDEQLRDRLLVVRDVVLKRRFHTLLDGFELAHHQRQPVDERHQVRAALVHLACHPQLRHQQEVIVRRGIPVHDLDALRHQLALRRADFHLHAVL